MSSHIDTNQYPSYPYGIHHPSFEKDLPHHVFRDYYNPSIFEEDIKNAMMGLLEGGQFKNEKNVGKDEKGNTK